MISEGQTIGGNTHQSPLGEGAGSVSQLDEKALLISKLAEIDLKILRLKDYEDFFQRLAQLEKYLQSPDPNCDYGKYDAAFETLSKTKARLSYVLANRSRFRDMLSFFGLMDTVQELEDKLERYGWIAEQLQKKLKLTRCISLQDEYEKLDAYLEKLIGKGFAPLTVSTQIQKLKIERGECVQHILEVEAKLHDSASLGRAPSANLLISEATQSYSADASLSDGKLCQSTEHQTSFSPPALDRRQTVFTHLDCWNALDEDLRFAVDSVVIVSPYLTMNRGWWFFKRFQKLIRNNISVTIITLPSEDHSENMIGPSASVIKKLRGLGVEVITVPKIHQKLIIIDSKISWEGSLNWLSHKDTAEHVRRIDAPAMVAEAEESLNIYLSPVEQPSDNLPVMRTSV